jgi:3-deoxy-D-manno-octulosonic-acid transferase
VWPLLYRLLLGPLVSGGARLVAIFSPKVRRGLVGRRRQRTTDATAQASDAFSIHVHAASVGEFEQAKPIIETLRRESRRYRITASFFSPSGFEQQGTYDQLDDAWYLPDDRPAHVRRFLDRIAPDLVVVIRYDLWPEFLRQAGERGIPSALVCGTMRADSSRLRPIARGFFGWLHGQLALIDCVGEEDAAAFRRLTTEVPIEVTGDTRYDRVVERADAGTRAVLPVDRRQLGDGLVLVAGSTWPADEALLAGLVGDERVRVVVVPHEPTPTHVASLRARLGRSVVLSSLAPGEPIEPGAALIVDRTGILLGLYALADIAYVGGAFGAGVHSVLEPAAYGIPVLAGPRIERSRDASALHAAGLLGVVDDAPALAAAVAALRDDGALRAEKGAASGQFVRERAGATGRILASLRRHGLLPAD